MSRKNQRLPSLDEKLDHALEETFPASDPFFLLDERDGSATNLSSGIQRSEAARDVIEERAIDVTQARNAASAHAADSARTGAGGWAAQEGLPFSLGATWIEEERAFNFALYSKHAESVELLLYAPDDTVNPVQVYSFDYLRNKSGRIWHCRMALEAMKGAAYYAYRVDGPLRAGRFEWHAFDLNKVPRCCSILMPGRCTSRPRSIAWPPRAQVPTLAGHRSACSASTSGASDRRNGPCAGTRPRR